MTEEIRRRKTTDPEMDAILVLTQALTPLDAHTCARVLKWAEDRFIEERKRLINEMALAEIAAQFDAIKQYAERLGVDDVRLVHSIAHMRSMKKLAAIDDDPAAQQTEADAVKEARGA